MTVLTINYKYGHGCMRLNLDDFIVYGNITKAKKLVNLMRCNDTVALEEFKQYMTDKPKELLSDMKQFANAAVDAHTKAGELKLELYKLLKQRERYKKSSVPYKTLTEQIKPIRDEVKEWNSLFRSHQSSFNKYKRSKELCEKILEIIN